jgi:hypothetical protein
VAGAISHWSTVQCSPQEENLYEVAFPF